MACNWNITYGLYIIWAIINVENYLSEPVLVAAQSKAYVFDRSPAEIVGSNPTGAWMFVVSVVCCLVEVSATD
jgi:uncharacterized membrane protein YjgN (DUF898 family)